MKGYAGDLFAVAALVLGIATNAPAPILWMLYVLIVTSVLLSAANWWLARR